MAANGRNFAIVTGASTGIGFGLAKICHRAAQTLAGGLRATETVLAGNDIPKPALNP